MSDGPSHEAVIPVPAPGPAFLARLEREASEALGELAVAQERALNARGRADTARVALATALGVPTDYVFDATQGAFVPRAIEPGPSAPPVGGCVTDVPPVP